MALVIVGLLLSVTTPGALRTLNQLRVGNAKALVSEMVVKTRAAAIQSGGAATLTITPTGSLTITAPVIGGSGTQTLGSVQNLTSRYGVSVTYPTSTTAITFNEQGIATSSGATTLVLSGGGRADTVVIAASGSTSP